MQTRDQAFLGTEPVGRLLMRLAIPTVIAQLVNMLYNIVDRIYIGHIAGIGSLALTGVGVCMPIIMIVTAFAGIFTPDAELLAFTAKALRIYCGALFIFGIQIACQMTFVSIGNAPCSIIVAILRKFVLLIPLIFILPHILPDRTMAVYTAEPVADTLAVIFTMVMFGTQFRKALKKLEEA